MSTNLSGIMWEGSKETHAETTACRKSHQECSGSPGLKAGSVDEGNWHQSGPV